MEWKWNCKHWTGFPGYSISLDCFSHVLSHLQQKEAWAYAVHRRFLALNSCLCWRPCSFGFVWYPSYWSLARSIVLGGTTIHNSMSFLTDVAQLGVWHLELRINDNCSTSIICTTGKHCKALQSFAHSYFPDLTPRIATLNSKCQAVVLKIPN